LNSFNCLINYGFSIDFYHIQARNVSLVDIALLPIELKEMGFKILYKNIKPHKEEY
jgi:hypothetical protein